MKPHLISMAILLMALAFLFFIIPLFPEPSNPPTCIFPPSKNIQSNFTRQEFQFNGIRIVMDDIEDLNQQHNKDAVNEENKTVSGYHFWNEDGGTVIYIPATTNRDINNKTLPNFEILGHEIWHDKTLGGQWHK